MVLHRSYGALRGRIRRLLLRSPVINVLVGRYIRLWDRVLTQRFVRSKAHTPVTRNQGNMIAYVQDDTWASSVGLLFDQFEPETIALVKSELKRDMVFVDLGAHVGVYTLLAAQIVGRGGRVFAFEPNPVVRTVLEENVLRNGYRDIVTVVPLGVAAASEHRSLYVSENDTGQSSLYRVPGTYDSAIQVATTTLDSYFKSQVWPEVDYIKMDIEGAEKAALDGMSELSRRNPCLKLIVEFNPRPMAALNTGPQALFDALENRGFTRLSIIDRELQLLHIPADITALTRRARGTALNLLCEKP